MGRMKDIYIETHELVEAVLLTADSCDDLDDLVEAVGNHLDKQGWQSPTEVTARRNNLRKIIIDTWANVISLGGTHEEAGVDLSVGFLDLVKACGFSQRELLGEAQDLVDRRKAMAMSEKPEPVGLGSLVANY